MASENNNERKESDNEVVLEVASQVIYQATLEVTPRVAP